MSFGWSAQDVWALVNFCREIVVNYSEGWRGTEQHIIGLRDGAKQFQSLLEELSRILESTGERIYFDLNPIKRTLHDCNGYLAETYTGLQKRHDEKQALDDSDSGAKTPKTKLERSADFLRKVGEVAKYSTWGKREVEKLQERLADQRESLSFYMQILQRAGGARIEQRLKSMETTMAEIHANISATHHGSPSISLRDTDPLAEQSRHDSDTLETIQNTIQRHILLVMEKRDSSENIEDDVRSHVLEELDRFLGRVRNKMQREAGGSMVGHGTHSPSSQITLSKALLHHNAQTIPRRSTFDSGFYEGLSTLDEEPSQMPDDERSNISTRAASLFSNVSYDDAPSTRRTSYHETIGPLTPSLATDQSFEAVRTLQREQGALPSRSPSTGTPNAAQPERRDSRQSISSAHSHVTWMTIKFKGCVKMVWEGTPTRCALEARYHRDGRLRAIRAINLDSSNCELPTLKFSNRPVPQMEPPNRSKDLRESRKVNIRRQPGDKFHADEAQYILEDEDDVKDFQELVYGQKLAFFKEVEKVRGIPNMATEAQYVRVWETRDDSRIRSIQYFASSEKKNINLPVAHIDIIGEFKKSKKPTQLEMKVRSEKRALTIEFKNYEDLQEFVDRVSPGLAGTHEMGRRG